MLRRQRRMRTYRRAPAAPAIPRPLAGFARVGGFYGRFADGGELKFIDTSLDDAGITSIGTLQANPNIIATGTTESTRIGRKCTIKSIWWKGRLTLAATTVAASTTDIIRIMIVLDKQTNGQASTALNILNTDDWESPINLANSGRFVTLWDRTFSLKATAGGTSAAGVHQFGAVDLPFSYFKAVSIPIEYDGITGALTEIRSNNIAVWTWANSGQVNMTSIMRLRFADA